MPARILAHLAFWTVMTCVVLGATAVVIVGYIPYLVFRTIFLTATGRLGEVTGRRSANAGDESARTA